MAFLLSTGMFPLPEVDTPSLDRTLGTLTRGDRGDIGVLANLKEIFSGKFLAKHAYGILKAFKDGTATNPCLHQVRNLLRDTGK